MNYREYLKKNIDKNARIIEFGPLNRPIFVKKQHNVYYADIKSKDDIAKLYTSNEYLSATGISVDLDSIVDIDYVVTSNYEKSFKGIEKFDYAVLSHVVEHMPNILLFFNEIKKILKENGKLILIYPDSRYCFDHYRNEVCFRDAYATFIDGEKENARISFDFVLNTIKENNSIYFWESEKISEKISEKASNSNVIYQNVKNNISLSDLHYWPFSDYGFVKFVFEAKKMGIFDFKMIELFPTEKSAQEFMCIFEKNTENNDLQFIKQKLDLLDPVIINNRNSKIINQKEEKINEQTQIINQKEEKINEQTQIINQKEEKINEQLIISKGKEKEFNYLKKRIAENNDKIKLLENELVSVYGSKSWKFTSLFRKVSTNIKRKEDINEQTLKK